MAYVIGGNSYRAARPPGGGLFVSHMKSSAIISGFYLLNMDKTKKCRECLSDIPFEARRCAHCGTKQPMRLDSRQGKLILALIGVFILAIVVTSASGGSSTSAPAASDAPQQVSLITAYTISQNYVRAILKAPSTADFPFADFKAAKIDDQYVVEAYVDSQNGFGAQIRSNWRTKLKYNGGEPADIGNWTLVELVFDGKKVYPAQ